MLRGKFVSYTLVVMIRLFSLFSYFLFGILIFCSGIEGKELPYVLVSVPPHQYFVEKIAGNTVEVGLLVPSGASAHTFEPTPKLMLSASKADIWFQVGESFEKRALQVLQNHNRCLVPIDLLEGLDLIYDDTYGAHHGCCHCSGGADLHYWLSARMARQQVKTIALALSKRYPENSALYSERLKNFLAELEQLDTFIAELLLPLKNRTLLVSHPAYAYFCRDYHLKQLSIEFEGKDPTPGQLTRMLEQARKEKISKIYIQPQYPNRGAKLVAEELGAELVLLDPYSGDYLNMMREIAFYFSKN